jgi:hypothetical protein
MSARGSAQDDRKSKRGSADHMSARGSAQDDCKSKRGSADHMSARGSADRTRSSDLATSNKADELDLGTIGVLDELSFCTIFTSRCADEMSTMTSTRLYTDDLFEETLNNEATLTKIDNMRDIWSEIEIATNEAEQIQPLISLYSDFIEMSGGDLSKIHGNKYVRLLFLWRSQHEREESLISSGLRFCAMTFLKMQPLLAIIQDKMVAAESQKLKEFEQRIDNEHQLAFPSTDYVYSLYANQLVTADSNKRARLWGNYVTMTQLFDLVHDKLVVPANQHEDRMRHNVKPAMEFELNHCKNIFDEIINVNSHSENPDYVMLAFVDLCRYLCQSSITEFRVSTDEVTPWMKHLIGKSASKDNENYYRLIVGPFFNLWNRVHAKKQELEGKWSDQMKQYYASVKVWCSQKPCWKENATN